MAKTSFLPRVATLLSVAVAGGAIALVGAWLLGGLGSERTTTIERVVPSSTPVALKSSGRNWINTIYQRVGGGVVQITSESLVETPTFPFGSSQQVQRALGSGFVIDKGGHILTNYHVVANARAVRVSFSNRDNVKAEVVGVDPSTDVAVLKVDEKASALTPLPLGKSDGVRVGDPVIAIGNPFGLQRSVTAGIVSALQREISNSVGTSIDHVIQTDAPINSGNSGGPLLDAQGQVIGINTAIETGNSIERGNVGIGFAVPINTAQKVAEDLIEHGSVQRGFLGVEVQPITKRLAEVVRLPVNRGLIVQKVVPGSAAADAGLRAGTTRVVVAGQTYLIGGDIVTSVDGKSVSSFETLSSSVSSKKPGDEVELDIYRNGKERTLTVKLGRQPAPAPPRP